MNASILATAGFALSLMGLFKGSDMAAMGGLICACSAFICLEISQAKGE